MEMRRSRPGGQPDERRDRGAAAVEMALVLPILLLVLFALVDFGRAYNMKIELTQAAREGVRVIALGGTEDEAKTRAREAMPAVDVTPGSSTLCAATTVTGYLTVHKDFTYLTPLGPIANTLLGVSSSTLPNTGTIQTLTATGAMRCAG